MGVIYDLELNSVEFVDGIENNTLDSPVLSVSMGLYGGMGLSQIQAHANSITGYNYIIIVIRIVKEFGLLSSYFWR